MGRWRTCVEAEVLRVRLREEGLDAPLHEQARRRRVPVEAACRKALRAESTASASAHNAMHSSISRVANSTNCDVVLLSDLVCVLIAQRAEKCDSA